jgi:secondary thiamine-phosphate synthase enzyme
VITDALRGLVLLQAKRCCRQKKRQQAENGDELVQRRFHQCLVGRRNCRKGFPGNRTILLLRFYAEEQKHFRRGETMASVKAHTEYLTFKTEERYEMVHITPLVEEIVRRSGIDDGLCFASPMHITAAIYVNDNEDGLIEDIGVWLEKLAPRWPGYRHHQTGEDNADAHLKALLLHHETTLPVTKGRLDLGTWQRVFYAEFDGQRSKRVIVKVLGVAKE